MRAARREIGELKKVVARLARLTATGMADDYLQYRRDDVADTLALMKGYIRLCELQMALGMTESEARADVDRLTADEVLAACAVPTEDPDPL